MAFKEVIKNSSAFFFFCSWRDSVKNNCSLGETGLFAADRRLLFLSII